MAAVDSSDMSVLVYQTTWHCFSVDRNLYSYNELCSMILWSPLFIKVISVLFCLQ